MISNLQLLRGLAALAVVYYHTAFTFNGVHTDFQAVSVFFVISGFIMTYITREDSTGFLGQRLIRIVPLYWLCTLAPILVTLVKPYGRLWADASFVTVAKSLFFIPYRDVVGDIHPLLAVGWTLNLEMFFYLIFAAMLVVSRRWAPLLTCLALAAFKLPDRLGCTGIACEFYAHGYTTFLIAGILSFYVWQAAKDLALAWRWITVPLAVTAAFIFVLWNAFPAFAGLLQQGASFDLFYAMPPLLILAALLLHSAKVQCGWKLALVMGDASYALYLTHTIVIELLRVTRNKIAIDQIASLDPKQSVWVMLAILVVCSAVAILVHYKIEVPMMRWLRRRFAAPKRVTDTEPPVGPDRGNMPAKPVEPAVGPAGR